AVENDVIFPSIIRFKPPSSPIQSEPSFGVHSAFTLLLTSPSAVVRHVQELPCCEQRPSFVAAHMVPSAVCRTLFTMLLASPFAVVNDSHVPFFKWLRPACVETHTPPSFDV